jgi:cytochrome b involved in lipid metabolism
LGTGESNYAFLKDQKYKYLQLNDDAIISVLKGLNYSAITNYIPLPTSSIVIEFYKSKDATATFNRKDYYVQINLDDNYINIPGVCTAGRCEWDTFSAHLETRLYKEMPLAKKCFSHL